VKSDRSYLNWDIKMSKKLICIAIVASITPSIANAQSRSMLNGAAMTINTSISPTQLDPITPPTGDPKLNAKLTDSLIGIPAPTGDPLENKKLNEMQQLNTSVAIPTPSGIGLINNF